MSSTKCIETWRTINELGLSTRTSDSELLLTKIKINGLEEKTFVIKLDQVVELTTEMNFHFCHKFFDTEVNDKDHERAISGKDCALSTSVECAIGIG
jgi:hypothetical protein